MGASGAVQAPDDAAPPPRAGAAVRSAIVLAGSEIVARAIGFLATAWLARRLAPEGFGILGFASTVVGYLAIGVTAGINDLGAREVARRPRDAGELAAAVVLVRLLLAVVALLVLGGVTALVEKPTAVKVVLLLAGLSLLTEALDTSWAYRGLERNGRVGAARILSQLLYLALLPRVVHGAADVPLVPIAQFLGEAAAALLLCVPLLRGRLPASRIRDGFRLLVESRYLTLAKLLRSVILTSDVVVLSLVVGEVEVGVYTAAYRVCFLLLAIGTIIQFAYLPSIARAAESGAGAVVDVTREAFALAAVVGAPLVIGGMVLAGPLLAALFGPDYARGATALQWLLLSVGLGFIRGQLHSLFVVYHRTKLELRILAVAAALNVALNLLLIPTHGIVGAALATVLAEGSVMLIGLRALAAGGVRLELGRLWRPLLAGAFAGAVLLAIDVQGWLILRLLGGSALYLAALVVVGGVPAGIPLALRAFRGWPTWSLGERDDSPGR